MYITGEDRNQILTLTLNLAKPLIYQQIKK